MTRINVYRYSSPQEASLGEPAELVGWYDSEKAERWSDADHNGDGSGGTGRGQAVIRTAGGRWVLQHWTRWQGEHARHEFISPEEAREWLLRNDYDEVVECYFGEIEEERGPGRPEIGPRVDIRIPPDLLAQVDAEAQRADESRAVTIRRLISLGLGYLAMTGRSAIAEGEAHAAAEGKPLEDWERELLRSADS